MRNIFIFDLDGTLIESKKSIIYAFNKVFKVNNLKKTNILEFNKLANFGSYIYIKNKFPNLKRKEVEKINNQFQEYYKNNCKKNIKMKKGLIFFLKKFQKNTNFYIATNKPKFASIEILNSLKIKDYFKNIYSGDLKKFKKPYGHELKKKIISFKRTKNVLIIGDSEADEKLAETCNVNFALIKNGYTKKKISKFNKKYLFKDFYELFKMIYYKTDYN